MIPFAGETVTLYNRRETKDAVTGRATVAWYRTELTGCFWSRSMQRVWDGTAVIMADTTTCKIPESPAYRDPAAWDALTSPTGYFTLAPGDIIVRGAVFDVVGPLLSVSAFVAKYKRSGVMEVASAANNTRPGSALGHYLARGA